MATGLSEAFFYDIVGTDFLFVEERLLLERFCCLLGLNVFLMWSLESFSFRCSCCDDSTAYSGCT